MCFQVSKSLPSRGAWIEIRHWDKSSVCRYRRSPHGERGLKYQHPAKVCQGDGRSPHGERGLKLAMWLERYGDARGRSPHGERGLKSFLPVWPVGQPMSLPSRGAWIEIWVSLGDSQIQRVAPLTGSVD